jgi:CopG antitoxin of type II toxin-antitoxin system
MKKKIKQVPKFRKEQDEREFWTTHDTTDFFDFSRSNRVEIEFDSGVEAPGEIDLPSIASRDAQSTQSSC